MGLCTFSFFVALLRDQIWHQRRRGQERYAHRLTDWLRTKKTVLIKCKSVQFSRILHTPSSENENVLIEFHTHWSKRCCSAATTSYPLSHCYAFIFVRIHQLSHYSSLSVCLPACLPCFSFMMHFWQRLQHQNHNFTRNNSGLVVCLMRDYWKCGSGKPLVYVRNKFKRLEQCGSK